MLKFHEKDKRLCIDAFWPNLKLLPVSDNEFEMEGFPVSFKFYNYRGIKKVKISKAKCYYKSGGVADKYVPFKIKDSILVQYCDTYWCEEDKLERKIILKNGKLYYWREKGNESELVTIKKTEFMMMAQVENKIEFKKVKGEWQFTFDVKERKPIHSVFMPKKSWMMVLSL